MNRILIIDDDVLDREAVRRALRDAKDNLNIEEAVDGRSALDLLNKEHYDCLVLDYLLPDFDGLQFLHKLADGAEQLPLPVVMLTGEGSESIAVQAMKLGVYDYLTKHNLSSVGLLSAINNALRKGRLQQQLDQANAKIKRMALYDSLTGLGNRYMFEDKIKDLMAIAERKEQPFALFMLDLDRFKDINDSQGHLVGDQVLANVGERLRHFSRSADLIFRTGGDEFIVLIGTGVTEQGTLHFAEKLIEVIRKPISLESGKYSVGLSIGIAIYPEHGNSIKQLIHHADAAMYAAKRNGGGIALAKLRGS
jgi:diguanylate cyclase (GGDEF)-like protein